MNVLLFVVLVVLKRSTSIGKALNKYIENNDYNFYNPVVAGEMYISFQ